MSNKKNINIKIKRINITYAINSLKSYDYVSLNALCSLYKKEDQDKILNFLYKKKIIDETGKPTQKALKNSLYATEIQAMFKDPFMAFKWEKLIKLIKKHTDILFDTSKFFYISGLGFGLDYFFKNNDIIYDIDGEDRDGLGRGEIVDVSPEFLKVKFEEKQFPVLVNSALFVYDRAGEKGAKRCYLQEEMPPSLRE